MNVRHIVRTCRTCTMPSALPLILTACVQKERCGSRSLHSTSLHIPSFKLTYTVTIGHPPLQLPWLLPLAGACLPLSSHNVSTSVRASYTWTSLPNRSMAVGKAGAYATPLNPLNPKLISAISAKPSMSSGRAGGRKDHIASQQSRPSFRTTTSRARYLICQLTQTRPSKHSGTAYRSATSCRWSVLGSRACECQSGMSL